MYRHSGSEIEVFLVHPGGPFWAKKDKGAWTVPKGEYGPDEDALQAACREFREETGFTPIGPFVELGRVQQKSGKLVTVWTFEGDCDPDQLVSNTCEIEWPPRSGRRMEFLKLIADAGSLSSKRANTSAKNSVRCWPRSLPCRDCCPFSTHGSTDARISLSSFGYFRSM